MENLAYYITSGAFVVVAFLVIYFSVKNKKDYTKIMELLPSIGEVGVQATELFVPDSVVAKIAGYANLAVKGLEQTYKSLDKTNMDSEARKLWNAKIKEEAIKAVKAMAEADGVDIQGKEDTISLVIEASLFALNMIFRGTEEGNTETAA